MSELSDIEKIFSPKEFIIQEFRIVDYRKLKNNIKSMRYYEKHRDINKPPFNPKKYWISRKGATTKRKISKKVLEWYIQNPDEVKRLKKIARSNGYRKSLKTRADPSFQDLQNYY